MDEKEYEHSVARYLAARNTDYEVKYNRRVIGRYSRRSRQIDVYLEHKNGESVIIECKYQHRKIDIKMVESFIGFLDDIAATSGILVTNCGSTRSAKCRIAEREITIDILDEQALDNFRLRGLMPHDEDRMASILEPLGYVTSPYMLYMNACCVLLPIGKPYAQSINDGTYVYVNITQETGTVWNKILKTEETRISEFYKGRVDHSLFVDDGFYVRKSTLRKRNRVDFAVIACFRTGSIVFHGIIEPIDFRWTITSIKKVLK
ncbi:MAG: restriction endonuclease, partial [Candidatus Competibacteraceae bacterium]|nr:restriction endonuclease [Candidatus Competibacteraceae bacterium]